MEGIISGAKGNFETHNCVATDTVFNVPGSDGGIKPTTKRRSPGAREDGL